MGHSNSLSQLLGMMATRILPVWLAPTMTVIAQSRETFPLKEPAFPLKEPACQAVRWSCVRDHRREVPLVIIKCSQARRIDECKATTTVAVHVFYSEHATG